MARGDLCRHFGRMAPVAGIASLDRPRQARPGDGIAVELRHLPCAKRAVERDAGFRRAARGVVQSLSGVEQNSTLAVDSQVGCPRECIALEGAMGKPEFSSSEQYLPPKTLAERLKEQAQENGHVEIVEIEAASLIAEPAPAAEPAPQRSSWSSGLVVMAFALVALVPVIAFGALYSRGALSVASLPAVIGEDRTEQTAQAAQPAPQAEPVSPVAQPMPPTVQQPPQAVQQAGAATPASSEASPASETILAKRDIELPPVTLTTPASVVGEAGKETAFAISLDSSENLPARS